MVVRDGRARMERGALSGVPQRGMGRRALLEIVTDLGGEGEVEAGAVDVGV